MRCLVTQVLLSISLAALAYSADSKPSDVDQARNKRSIFSDPNFVRRLRARLPSPFSLRRDRHAASKRSDLSSLLYDDYFMNDLPEPEEPVLPVPAEKERISNEIPGAHGPYHEPEPPTADERLADDLMNEFWMFVQLKQLGLLDKCMGKR